MFNIGGAELILILLIAFLVVGPKDLPKIGRALGRGVKYIQGIVKEIKKESGLDEVESLVKDVEKDVRDIARTSDIRQELNDAAKAADVREEIHGLEKELKQSVKDAQIDLKDGGKQA